MFNKRWAFVALFVLIGAVVLAACAPQTETVTVEVTRVVTETVEVEGEAVVQTVVVVETVVETVEVEAPQEEAVAGPKDLIVCMAQEPDTMYPAGGSMLAARAVQHAIFTSQYTTLSYDYQPVGLVKLPSLADGDAVVNVVEVTGGEAVVDSAGNPATLEEGVEVMNADKEAVVFDGTPIMMEQMVVDFEIMPRNWSDGEPVTSADYLFTYQINGDPDTPTSKATHDRTAVYEATGDLSVRWTGVPGFLDSTYFINAVPGGDGQSVYPEHAWSGFTAAEMIEAEETSRLPVGDGGFRIVDWVAGDSIVLEPNEFFWGADQGMPYLDSLTYKFIPDTNQLLAQLLSGACDIGTQDGMDAGQSPFLIEAEAGGLLTPYFQTGTVYEHIDFGINSWGDYGDGVGRPDWFEDVRVRQAMTMCTDRQSMVDNILYGRSEVIHSYIPSVHPLYPEGLTEWPYDVEAANALLDEVGYVDSDGDGIREDAATGAPFHVTLGTTTGNEMRQQLTQIFKENLLECGIDVELYYLPSSEWFADGPDGVLFGRRFDLGEFAWLTGVEPSCSLYLSSAITGPGEEINPLNGLPYGGWGNASETGWVNEEFDLACNAAQGNLPGTTEYEENHKEAQRIFSEEVPVIPLFLRLKVAAARPEVLNFGVDPTQNSELYNIYEIDLQQ
ncbi:MAG: peptide ABC transporter substrate-binding protein [Anaerolineales bacterium]|nr:peptide ABC transporter substrate-binding protein [Anaerolineales bacterium]MCA9928631.1 peptide ABC transporter substrate-binding protein [Anaerolineales bacterium]